MTIKINDFEAILWDIGGVILDIESARRAQRHFLDEFVDEYDIDMDLEVALATWRSAVGEYFTEREGTTFRASRNAYARGIEALVGEPLQASAWLPLFREVQRETMQPIPGVVGTIERVAETSLHVGALSDIDAEEGKQILSWFAILECFDAVTTSEEVGKTKPDPEMFETALSKARSPPERTLMIGDRYRHDIQGAANAGLVTVAFGAEPGPAVDFEINDPRDVFEILNSIEPR